MSSFVRNLVLRAAGLAPVLKPQAPPVVGFRDDEPPVDEIEVTEAAAPPVSAQTETPERPPRSIAKPQASQSVPGRPRPEPAGTQPREPESQKARKVAEAAVAPPRPRPADVRQPAPPSLRAEPELPREPNPSIREAPELRPAAPTSDRAPQAAAVLAPAIREERVPPESRDRQTRVEKVREIEFVDRPALPPEILEQVTAVVSQHVPDEPGRVDVHIGRIEISVPPPPLPVPAQRFAPRPPRGFAEHTSERRYLRRRWY